MKIKFWGVRGSHPVPGMGTLRYGGNTACVEVAAGRQSILLDAGTGIIGVGQEMAARARATGAQPDTAILFSHLHHDHTQGFLFFAPAHIPGGRLQIFGPGIAEGSLEQALACLMEPPNFPITLLEMAARKEIVQLVGGESFRLGSADIEAPQVRTLRSYAHPGGVLIYRIDWRGRSVVYATDTEGYLGVDQRLVSLAQSADVLIHDAQYSEDHYRGRAAGRPAVQGFGHSTYQMACEVAQAAGVKKLVLFHHDPSYDDALIAKIEASAKAQFPNTLAAFEGLEIYLEPEMDVPAAAETLFKQTHPSGPARSPAPAQAAAGLFDAAAHPPTPVVRARTGPLGPDGLSHRPT